VVGGALSSLLPQAFHRGKTIVVGIDVAKSQLIRELDRDLLVDRVVLRDADAQLVFGDVGEVCVRRRLAY
jgi:hypothetical protein